MTATLTYNPRNRVARMTMEYLQSLGVFEIKHLPSVRSSRSTAKRGVDAELMHDLKGALGEVKASREGKTQMKDAYELFNEL